MHAANLWQRLILPIAFIFALCARVSGAVDGEAKPAWSARFQPVAPCPAVAATAQANHIPLDRIDPSVDGDALNPGDSITGLVTLHEKGGRSTQWLIYLQVVPSEAKGTPDKRGNSLTLYTSWGGKYEFKSSPVSVSARTLGPFFPVGDKRKAGLETKSASFKLNQGFLGLGLDGAAATILQLRGARASGNIAGKRMPLNISDRPFSEAAMATGREFAETNHISSEQVRSFCGALPALYSYFDCVQRTPGIQDIFLKTVDMPSIWSIIRHGGVDVDFKFRDDRMSLADAFAWESSPGTPAYYFGMSLALNQKPALNLTFVVTAPQPPLLGCGGIVGLLAEKPGDAETYLTMRVISARRAATVP